MRTSSLRSFAAAVALVPKKKTVLLLLPSLPDVPPVGNAVIAARLVLPLLPLLHRLSFNDLVGRLPLSLLLVDSAARTSLVQEFMPPLHHLQGAAKKVCSAPILGACAALPHEERAGLSPHRDRKLFCQAVQHLHPTAVAAAASLSVLLETTSYPLIAALLTIRVQILGPDSMGLVDCQGVTAKEASHSRGGDAHTLRWAGSSVDSCPYL